MIELTNDMKTLFILPHLDDEFALAPLINTFVDTKKDNCFFLYCAEEIFNPNRHKRRAEALAVIEYFDISINNVLFLNDYFCTQTRKLYEVFHNAKSLIENYIKKWQIKQIVTLGFEGGHPDHDVMAILVNNLKTKLNLIVYYAPAYSKYAFGPLFIIQVCRPLPTQKHLYQRYSIKMYDWLIALKIAFFYRSQLKTFLKLVPFILPLVFFRHYIYLSNKLEISSVDWHRSLSNLRYDTDIEIINRIANDNSKDE